MSDISFEVAEVSKDWKLSDGAITIFLRSKDKTLKLIIPNDDGKDNLIGQIMFNLGRALGGFYP